MNQEELKILKDKLQLIKSVGITECIIEPVDDNTSFIRGIDKTFNIAILDNVNVSLDNMICIIDVGNFVDCLSTYDFEEVMKIKLVCESEGFYESLVVSNDDQETIIDLVNPNRIEAPSEINDLEDTLAEVTLKDELLENVRTIAKTKRGSIKNKVYKVVCMSSKQGKLSLEISDEDGNFSKINLSDVEEKDNWTFVWNLEFFLKLLRTANKKKDEIRLTVANNSILFVNTQDTDFLLLPDETI